MGLDISAYSRLTPAPDAEMTEDGEPVDWENIRVFYINPDFPGRADELREGVAYSFADADGFRAGSYSGFNLWRSMLCAMIGTTPQRVWQSSEPGPFVELVNFSDCEGVIGAAVSAKLAQDFRDWNERAASFADQQDEIDGEYFVRVYRDFAAAFALASDGGAVEFH